MKKKTPITLFIIFAGLLITGSCAAQNVTNYTFSATTGTYSVLQGTAGSTSPALSGGTLDDGYYNAVPIGFTFTFDGTSYTTLAASTNGWITLGNTLFSSAFTNNLATGTPRPVIAPLWDDLAMSAAGTFTYYTSGTFPNRIFTAEWLNVKWNYLAGAAGISFQLKLYESNKRVEFIYRQEAGALNSASASIGLAGATSGTYLSLNGTGASPSALSSSETTTLNAKPATGQVYDFDTYAFQPVITSFSPAVGPLGTTVTITGNNFDPLPSADAVYFGATQATVVAATKTQLTVTVPAGTNYKNLSVTTTAFYLSAFSAKPFDVTFSCGGYLNSSSFNPRVNFSCFAGSSTLCAAVGDIDGDGKPEIVSGSDYGSTNNFISIFRNTTTNGIINAASFAPRVDFGLATFSAPFDVQLGDLDGDGKLDVVFSDFGTHNVCVFRNTSSPGVINSGSLAARIDLTCGSGPRGLKICDFDGDGKPDIAVACGWADVISVFHNTSSAGNISFTRTDFAATAGGLGPYDVGTGDIDGDGKPDLVVTNNGANSISVFRNTCTSGTINAASFAAKVDFADGSATDGIEIADIDGDSKPDIATTNLGANTFTVFRNTATAGVINAGSLAAAVPFTTGSSPYDLTIGDFDGDGKPDVATQNNASNTMSVFKNTAVSGIINASSFAAKVDFATAAFPYSITNGDLDGDAKPEILVPSYGSAVVSVFENMVSPYSAIAPLTVTGSTSYCDNGSWKTFYDPGDPTKVLFAVKDNGNALGTVTVNEYEDGAPGTYNNQKFLARHFKITPGTQPSSSVQVRLFITAAELTALQTADPTNVTGIGSLSVTKYDGPTEDNIYNPTDATSLVWIPQGSITTNSAYGGYYLEFSIASFSEFWIHGGTGVLPIELLDFNAAVQNQQVHLSWTTGSETNNDFFTIERSKDGANFQVVAVVNGAGNSSHPISYSAVDENPFPGTSYYRLKQTDFNGHFTYSGLRAVNITDADDVFSVFPNPSDGAVNVACPGDPSDTVTIVIFDEAGRMISTQQLSIGELRQTRLQLDRGVYIVEVNTAIKKYTRREIVY